MHDLWTQELKEAQSRAVELTLNEQLPYAPKSDVRGSNESCERAKRLEAIIFNGFLLRQVLPLDGCTGLGDLD